MELTNSVAIFMAYVHGTVNEMSKLYMLNEKRYNYTTPKSFLELISLYSKLLNEKTCDLKDKIIRLENGILKLAECAKQVDSLQVRFNLIYYSKTFVKQKYFIGSISCTRS